ncbi:MAG: hypothetical protein ACLP8B_19430 [Xanthobacteraceae bacterium]|jgi:hypothetical protein
MLSTLSAPDLTFVFIGVVIGLGSAVVAMLAMLEGLTRRPRSGGR